MRHSLSAPSPRPGRQFRSLTALGMTVAALALGAAACKPAEQKPAVSADSSMYPEMRVSFPSSTAGRPRALSAKTLPAA